MRSFLSRLTGTPRARILIKPDHEYVFLSGYGEDAQGEYLRGKVCLVLPKGEHVEGVQLRFTGRLALCDHKADDYSDLERWKSEEFYVHQWEPFLLQNRFHCSAAANEGSYQWPFELFIPGTQEESIRGCSRCHISYRLEASIIRPSPSSRPLDLLPIRLIRCPPLSAFELLDPFTSQGTWSAKVDYSVSISRRAIALGGLIPIEAHLTLLGPEVEIRKVRFYLCEMHTVSDKLLATCSAYEGYRRVAEWSLPLPEQVQNVHEWEDRLELPRVVRDCSPDFDARGMAVSHILHFAVTVKAADGSELEYETLMPITLFVSQEFPVTGWGVFARANAKDRAEIIEALSEGMHIPPKYDAPCGGAVCECDDPPPAYSPAGPEWIAEVV
ncbi:hypothetical protein GQ53DRAFT_843138 [Thozetella sp. PMI_491]|nr:hypothetical protein GQ53DRAFT_843138 [Thozetella sp. PMI_491]